MSSDLPPYIETLWDDKPTLVYSKNNSLWTNNTISGLDWSTEVSKPINVDLDSMNYNVTILGEILTAEELRDIVTTYYKQNYPEKLV